MADDAEFGARSVAADARGESARRRVEEELQTEVAMPTARLRRHRERENFADGSRFMRVGASSRYPQVASFKLAEGTSANPVRFATLSARIGFLTALARRVLISSLSFSGERRNP